MGRSHKMPWTTWWQKAIWKLLAMVNGVGRERNRQIGGYAGDMERKPKPDLDERFSLYGEDPEEVLRRLLADEDEQESREDFRTGV